MAQCLITGCNLFVADDGKALHGDLHLVGECFVFNGVLKGFDTAWLFAREAELLAGDPTSKTIRLIHGAPYFDRRGVVVFDRKHASLNGTARTYLQSSPFTRDLGL